MRCVDVLDENVAQKSAIHNSIDKIYNLYGKQRHREFNGLTMISGD